MAANVDFSNINVFKSRKTNIAYIATLTFLGIGRISTDHRTHIFALGCAFIVALVSITYQYWLDRKSQHKRNEV